MRRLLSWIVAVAVLLGVAYLASPYYAVYRVVQTARAGDGRTVAGLVDFPAVRSSLKPQLTVYLQQEIAREGARPHSFLDQLKLAVAPYLVGPSTDLLVTPQNVAAMIRTARPPRVVGAVGHEPQLADDAGPGDVRMGGLGYVGDDLDQFRTRVTSRSHPDASVELRMLRRGFFGWRVVSLDLSALPHGAPAAPPAG